MSGKSLLICICNFHVLSDLLLIYTFDLLLIYHVESRHIARKKRSPVCCRSLCKLWVLLQKLRRREHLSYAHLTKMMMRYPEINKCLPQTWLNLTRNCNTIPPKRWPLMTTSKMMMLMCLWDLLCLKENNGIKKHKDGINQIEHQWRTVELKTTFTNLNELPCNYCFSLIFQYNNTYLFFI